ncbi:hypothetical protein [Enterobacter asburiae]|uniref:hypothetical protein n=1 Tax=Enterobacter asburiae TaxID=61645 RepID=UPI0021CECAD8|nr:hypothetical protein [Enterobacter asburiae]MCU6244005.1 hypothetical protein [Enterobacter asburiae]
MKKLTTVGALALCTLLAGCSHTEATTTLTAIKHPDARIRIYNIDALPTAPVSIGTTTITRAQLQRGVLVDDPDAALKAVTGKQQPMLIDDSISAWGGSRLWLLRCVTEKCSGTDNLLRADLYIYRLPAPQDTLAYSFHASTTEPSGDVATWSRSLHPELAIAYHPGKTLMIGDTVAPANKSAMITFITPTSH